jgi:hypothetical protein
MDKKYTFKNIMLILIILSMAYIYCFTLAPIIDSIKGNTIIETIRKIHRMCYFDCNSKNCNDIITTFRGENYFLTDSELDQKNINNCIITFWGLSHILLYFILTFLLPSFYIEFFIFGIIFEIYEYYFFKCHDIMDIFLNTIGIIIGKYLSPYNIS